MIKVLIVDDSEVACRVLSREIAKAPDMEVVGTATDPYVARDQIVRLHPDVITLDLEMPRMNGLTFLGRLMCFYPLRVVVVSSQTPEGSDTALLALELGAVDVLGKPDRMENSADFGRAIIEKIRAAATARSVERVSIAAPPKPAAQVPPIASTPYSVVAIGASTGGTEALRRLLFGLPANIPGILIVQHMPELFVERFANRLNGCCALDVRVAQSGDEVEPGVALIAPGNRHMTLISKGSRYAVQFVEGPPVHHQRPSIDVLFHSVAGCAGPLSVGVLLTGMGLDGARGLLAMRQAGARTLAQDEASCVVFGMPKEAIRLEAVERVVPLANMASSIVEVLSQSDRKRQARATLCAVKP